MDVKSKHNVTRFGNGNQTIMFAHGYGCDQNMWRFVAPAFEDDYDVVLFDYIGSGKTDEKLYDFDRYSSLEGYADDIIQLCEGMELKDVIFVGHSVSAMIGVLAVGKRPELFKNLIMIGPSPCYINQDGYFGGFSKKDIDELVETMESNYMGWASFITPVIAGNPGQPQVAEELENSFCRMKPDIAKHFARVTFLGDNRKDLAKVSVPSLVIQSDPDAIAPVEVGQFVHQNLQNSTFKQLNAAGHCPHMTAPEQTIDAILAFLNNPN